MAQTDGAAFGKQPMKLPITSSAIQPARPMGLFAPFECGLPQLRLN